MLIIVDLQEDTSSNSSSNSDNSCGSRYDCNYCSHSGGSNISSSYSNSSNSGCDSCSRHRRGIATTKQCAGDQPSNDHVDGGEEDVNRRGEDGERAKDEVIHLEDREAFRGGIVQVSPTRTPTDTTLSADETVAERTDGTSYLLNNSNPHYHVFWYFPFIFSTHLVFRYFYFLFNFSFLFFFFFFFYLSLHLFLFFITEHLFVL